MSAPRFYIDHPLAPGARFSLPPGPARHAARALRLAVGDAVTLFNGQGGEHEARIERIQKDEVAVSIGSFADIERESHLRVMLVQGISSGERMDYTLQKAVELGVMAIQPIAAKRSVVKLTGERADRRVAHWQGVVTSACEQCGRNQIPAVAAPLTLANWLGHTMPQGLQPVVARSPLGHTMPQGLPSKGNREPKVDRGAPGQHVAGRLLFLSPLAESRLADLPAPTAMDSLVAGPEGGFEADEIAALLAAGAIPVRLGPRVLRTETAALAALAAMQTLWGDF
jgi:16S rRNA (uracil1498-N3)-methyltransferase